MKLTFTLRSLALLVAVFCGVLTLALAVKRKVWVVKERRGDRHVLQRTYSADRRVCLELQMQYSYKTEGFIMDIAERHTISDVVLRCIQYKASEEEYPRLTFERRFLGHWQTGYVSYSVPLWTSTFVGDLRLPTARCTFLDSSDECLLAVFDGSAFEFYRMDSRDKEFQKITEARHVRSELQRFFRQSFAPDDAYWSIALVECASVFGMEVARPSKTGKVSCMAALYEAWRTAREK